MKKGWIFVVSWFALTLCHLWRVPQFSASEFSSSEWGWDGPVVSRATVVSKWVWKGSAQYSHWVCWNREPSPQTGAPGGEMEVKAAAGHKPAVTRLDVSSTRRHFIEGNHLNPHTSIRIQGLVRNAPSRVLTSDLLDKKLGPPCWVFTSLPGNSSAPWHLRSPSLKQALKC